MGKGPEDLNIHHEQLVVPDHLTIKPPKLADALIRSLSKYIAAGQDEPDYDGTYKQVLEVASLEGYMEAYLRYLAVRTAGGASGKPKTGLEPYFYGLPDPKELLKNQMQKLYHTLVGRQAHAYNFTRGPAPAQRLNKLLSNKTEPLTHWDWNILRRLDILYGGMLQDFRRQMTPVACAYREHTHQQVKAIIDARGLLTAIYPNQPYKVPKISVSDDLANWLTDNPEWNGFGVVEDKGRFSALNPEHLAARIGIIGHPLVRGALYLFNEHMRNEEACREKFFWQ